jgi:hypothetical protein
MNKRVFLSYAWSDHQLAQNAIQQLYEKGLLERDVASIDYPETQATTQHIRNQIKERIRTSDIVVLIWSRHAAESPWVQYELGIAQALERPILIAWADKLAPDLPTQIKESQVLQLDTELTH